LNNNILILNKPWNPSQPMEELFAQIDICIKFAKSVDPNIEPTQIQSALTNIKNTGLFDADIWDWNKLEPAAKPCKHSKLLSYVLTKTAVLTPPL
jgi:hypothetical protein